LEVDDAKRLKELERESSRLKIIVAEQAINIHMLKEVSPENF